MMPHQQLNQCTVFMPALLSHNLLPLTPNVQVTVLPSPVISQPVVQSDGSQRPVPFLRHVVTIVQLTPIETQSLDLPPQCLSTSSSDLSTYSAFDIKAQYEEPLAFAKRI